MRIWEFEWWPWKGGHEEEDEVGNPFSKFEFIIYLFVFVLFTDETATPVAKHARVKALDQKGEGSIQWDSPFAFLCFFSILWFLKHV